MQTHFDTEQDNSGWFKSYKKCLLLALEQTSAEYNESALLSTKGNNALHIGANLGDEKIILFAVKCFITQPGIITFESVKSFVDTSDEHGFSALHLASLEGNSKCAKILIRYGADMYLTTNGRNATAIDIAKKQKSSNHKETSALLIKLSQELERNGFLMEQLEAQMEVICSQSINSPDIIQEISNLIITKNVDINFTDPIGDTPLHLACLASNEYLMVNLLFFKANTTSNRNEKSRTLLHYACKHMLTIRFFLAKKFPYLLIIRDSKGYYPMHFSAKNGDLEFLTFLFDRFMYPLTEQTPKDESTRLYPQTDIEEGPHPPNPRRPSAPEVTTGQQKIFPSKTEGKSKLRIPIMPPLTNKSKSSKNSKSNKNVLSVEVEKRLFEEKFSTYMDLGPKNEDELSLNLSNMSYCIKRLSLMDRAINERSMLHFAVAKGHFEIVEFLIEVCDVHAGFSDQNVSVCEIVNNSAECGISPLTEAFSNNRVDIAKFLLDNQAQFSSTTCRTLSKFLDESNPTECLSFLQSLGSDKLEEFFQIFSIVYSTDTPHISSLLHSLMKEESYQIMAFLLANKVTFNMEALIIAFTLCIVERRAGHLELLIEKFPKIYYNDEVLLLEKFLNQTNINISFIYEAVKVKEMGIVNLLLKSGADPNVYVPNSLEKNLLYMAYKHSQKDSGELFLTLLDYGITINLQEAIEGVGNYAYSLCIIWLLALHVTGLNLQPLSIKRRVSHWEFIHDSDSRMYEGSVLWDDFGFQLFELRWIAVCAYIVDNLDAMISDYRIAHSTTFPKATDTNFQRFVVNQLKTSKIVNTLSPSYLRESNIGKLSFQNNKLNKVPIEVFDLPNLKELNLSDNYIDEIPERKANSYSEETDEDIIQSRYGCKSLEMLDVANNQLELLPPDLFYLPKITEVEASNNKIDYLPPELWLAESLTTLKLNRNQLHHLTKPNTYSVESGVGSSLNARTFSFIQIKRKRVETMPNSSYEANIPTPKEPIKDISSNPLDFLPISEDNTSDLSSPNDTDTGTCTQPTIEDKDRGKSVRHPLPIPNWTDYSSLLTIELSFNKFSVFPHDLACIAPKLQRLDMRNNKLKQLNILLDLPKSLHLMLFDNNQITTLSEKLDPISCCSPCCVAFERRDKNSKPNWCTHRQFAPFPLLQTISFNNNMLTDLPLEITLEDSLSSDFTKSNNNTKKSFILFPSILALSISENKFTEVPQAISLLTSITSLNLALNHDIKQIPLKSLVPLKSLSNLFYINLSGLEIEGVPDYILKGQAPRLIGFLASQSQDTKSFRTLKLSFMGDEGKGKSTLLSHLGKGKISAYGPSCVSNYIKPKQLLDPYKPTAGVETSVWNLNKPRKWDYGNVNSSSIRFICWDFAGKEEYFPAYQGFLCQRSIFILVWDISEGVNGVKGLEKWLQCIGHNVHGSSCFIVGTCLNKVKMKKPTMKDMTEHIKEIFKKSHYLYPKLLSIQFLDCFDEEKVSQLRDFIFLEATKLSAKEKSNSIATPILDKLVSVNQINLIHYVTYIKDQSEVKNKIRILNGEQFRGLISKVWQGQPMEDNEFQNAVRFLHSTGYLMHFEDDPELMDYYVINMEWLCNKFVAVLRSQMPPTEHQQLTKCGVVQKDNVFDILKKLNIHEYDQSKFIVFMKKFEILIELSEKFFIFPSLLPKEKLKATQLTLKFNFSSDECSSQPECIFCPQIEFDTTNSLSAVPYKLLSNFPTFHVEAPKQSKLQRRDSTKIAFSQWIRLYLTPLLPSDFWARLLSRVIADQSYLATLQNYLTNYLKTYQSDEVGQAISEITDTLQWKVWNNGLGLYVANVEILQVSYMLLPSLHFTELYLVDHDPDEEQPSKGEFTGGVHVLVREWEAILNNSNLNSNLSPTSSTENRSTANGNPTQPSDPSISLQLATWLLQRSSYHVEEVFDEWKEKLYSVRRSMFQSVTQHLTCYIPCPKCYHTLSKHIEVLAKESLGLPIIEQSQNTEYLEMNSIHPITREDIESQSEVINELFVYSIIYLCSLARDGKKLSCPVHSLIELTYLIPDILFQDLPGKMVYSFEQVKKNRLIGEGGYGKVFRGKVLSMITSQEQDIALKEVRAAEDALMNPENMNEQHYQVYKSCSVEVRVLVQLKHANILQMVGVTLSPYCILMEIAPQGDLNKIIKLYNKAKSYISSQAITMTCKQVASALAYLHSLRIIYRDLKPSNILVFEYPLPVTEQNQSDANSVLVKVADYGISSFLAPYGLKGGPGTEKYMAPEMLKKSAELSYCNQIDVYAFGLVIYCLITLETPFANDPIPTAKHKTLKGARPEVPIKARPRAIYLLDLMRWCWAHNPKERPTFPQIEEICSTESFQRLLFACRVTRHKKNPTCGCLVQSSSKLRIDPTKPMLRKQRSSTQAIGKRKTSTTPDDIPHIATSCSVGNLADMHCHNEGIFETRESNISERQDLAIQGKANRDSLRLNLNIDSPLASPSKLSCLDSLASDDGCTTPIDEDLIPNKLYTSVSFLKPVVSIAFTNSQLWYGTGEGNLNFFEVLEKEFRVKGAQKFNGSRIHCMVSTENHVWIATDNTGIHIFAIRCQKKLTNWVYTEENSGVHHREILCLAFIEEYDYLIASSSSRSLFVFTGASNPDENIVPSFVIDQKHAGVCMAISRLPNQPVRMWCGSDNYKIILYSCEPDGTLVPNKENFTFEGPKRGKRPNIEQIWSFDYKDKVVCSVGCELGQLSLTEPAWIQFVSCTKLLDCTEYQGRITAMVGYQGLLYIGTGYGAILVLDPVDLVKVGKIHEYNEPVRVLIPTESNFNRLVSNPSTTRPVTTPRRVSCDLIPQKPQSLLIAIGLSYQGITKSHKNTPKTLEAVVEWDSTHNHVATKPDTDDGYLLIFSLKGWAS